MKSTNAILLICLTAAMGFGCGEKAESEDERRAERVADGTTDPEADADRLAEARISIPANCTLDEVSTLHTERSISRGSELIARISYEINPEGVFVSINEQDCDYQDVFFVRTAATTCHTNVPCGDRQYEYFVDYTNRGDPIWVLQDDDTSTRWILGSFTGTLPATTSSTTTSSPTTGTTTTPTNDGRDWEDDVRDASRSGGEAMPYSGPIVW